MTGSPPWPTAPPPWPTAPPPWPTAPPPVVWVPDGRSRLQRAMDGMRAYDPRPWGWRPAVVPLLALLVLAVVGGLVGEVVHVHSYAAALVLTAVLDVGLYLLLAGAVVVAGREVARRYGGFGNAFGLRKPVWRDLIWVGAGVGLVFAFRIAISIVTAATLGTKALRQGSNLQITHPRLGAIVIIAVVACAFAPVVEELIFRGVLLRTLMRRVGFWPATLVSSALFGLFHTYEVSTLAGAVVLASVTASLGFTNCLLVRWTERLTPGIAVHALFNGLAVLVLALR